MIAITIGRIVITTGDIIVSTGRDVTAANARSSPLSETMDQ
jgi:hypothetical protein